MGSTTVLLQAGVGFRRWVAGLPGWAAWAMVASVAWGSAAQAQNIPPSATPRGVVYAFLTATASTDDSVDRAAFLPRLTGELLHPNPGRFKGMVPEGAAIRIDTIPNVYLGSDERTRAVAYCRVIASGAVSDYYFYCVGDSIWRIEAIEQFPNPAQSRQMAQSLDRLDSTTESYWQLRGDFRRMLMPDDSLKQLLKRNIGYTERVVPTLVQAVKWKRFPLRETELVEIDEYRELDDDIDPDNLIFYKLDRDALVALDRQLGIRRIERDGRYPGVLFMVAGELAGRSYGYFYSESPEWIPPVSLEEFIMIKPVAERWWLYKRKKTAATSGET